MTPGSPLSGLGGARRGREGKGREQVTTVQVTTVGSGESALDSQPWDPSAGKESTCNAGDLGSIPGLGRSPGEGEGSPLQYSGLENFMDCIVHRVAESDMTKRRSLHSGEGAGIGGLLPVPLRLWLGQGGHCLPWLWCSCVQVLADGGAQVGRSGLGVARGRGRGPDSLCHSH